MTDKEIKEGQMDRMWMLLGGYLMGVLGVVSAIVAVEMGRQEVAEVQEEQGKGELQKR